MNVFSPSSLIIGYNHLIATEALITKSEFSLPMFEDFNTLVEGVVLFDKLIILGEHGDQPADTVFSALQQTGVLEQIEESQLRIMFKNVNFQNKFFANLQNCFLCNQDEIRDLDVMTVVNQRICPTDMDRLFYLKLFSFCVALGGYAEVSIERMTRWLRREAFDTRSESACFWFLARALVYDAVAEIMGTSFMPDFPRMSVTALASAKSVKPISKGIYDELVKLFRSEVEALALLGMPVRFFLPPLTAIILSKAPASPTDYISEILRLRDQFSVFRRRYSELAHILENEDLPLRKKLAAKKKYYDDVVKMLKGEVSKASLTMRIVWDGLIAPTIGDFSIHTAATRVISLLLKQLNRVGIKGRAKSLFDLWINTLNIREYGKLLENNFKCMLDSDELEKYKLYSRGIREIIDYKSAII